MKTNYFNLPINFIWFFVSLHIANLMGKKTYNSGYKIKINLIVKTLLLKSKKCHKNDVPIDHRGENF